MQSGGFGGQGPGQPPHGFPPGAAPPHNGVPANPQGAQQYGAQQPGAPQYAAAQQPYGTPAQQPYGAPQYGMPGAPAPQQYGAPGAPQYGAPQMPGVPQMPPGAQMPGAMQLNMPGAAQMGAVHNSFGQAQTALSGAGSMIKMVKYAFIGLGGLCVLGGIVLLLLVDAMTGIMTAMTGGILIVVALLVLPKFTGMLGQATAMVDGFAAKEQLAQTGIPAQGRLLSVQQTGRLVNYNPEIQVMVEVTHPQLGVYQTQTTAIVPQIAIPRAQPGAQVQVRVSPQNQHEIALVF